LTLSIVFAPHKARAFFKFTSLSAGTQNTAISFVSLCMTIVLKTLSGAAPAFSAIRSAAPNSSLWSALSSYSKVR